MSTVVSLLVIGPTIEATITDFQAVAQLMFLINTRTQELYIREKIGGKRKVAKWSVLEQRKTRLYGASY